MLPTFEDILLDDLAFVMAELATVQKEVGDIYEAHIKDPTYKNEPYESEVFTRKAELELKLEEIDEQIDKTMGLSRWLQ